jgi:lysophospholipase L1-like esterase
MLSFAGVVLVPVRPVHAPLGRRMPRTHHLIHHRRIRPQAHPIRRRSRPGAAVVAALAGLLVMAAVATSVPTHAGVRAAPVADVAVPTPAAASGPLRRTTSDGLLARSDVPEARGAPRSAAVAASCTPVHDPSSASPVRAAATGSTKHDKARATTRLVLPTGSARKTVRAAFLGDSYTTGWAGSGYGPAGWPAIVSRALGWRPRNLAVAGTGFVNPGWTGQPIRTRVAAAIAARPRVVVLAAGHNDARFGTRASAAAADAVIDRLRRALPNALLVVVAPIWANGSPPDAILGLRNRLKRKAAAVHAVFIDPLRGRWFAGSWHRYIGPDGIHPTDAGHRHIARMVLAALRDATGPAATRVSRQRATRTPVASPRAPTGPAAASPAAASPASGSQAGCQVG